jgi:hypothetical protein
MEKTKEQAKAERIMLTGAVLGGGLGLWWGVMGGGWYCDGVWVGGWEGTVVSVVMRAGFGTLVGGGVGWLVAEVRK